MTHPSTLIPYLLRPSRIGDEWELLDDLNLKEDVRSGCDLFIMSKRARRTEAEIADRMKVLGLTLQPPRKIRRIDWSRSDR